MLSMLIRLMLAQAQECLFEKLALPGIRNQFCPLMKMSQEAAKVKLPWEIQCPLPQFFSLGEHQVMAPLMSSLLFSVTRASSW